MAQGTGAREKGKGARMVIYEQRTLTDGHINIIQNTVVEGEAPDGYQRFVVHVNATLELPDHRRVPLSGTCHVPGSTPAEAFANAPPIIEKFAKSLVNEARSRIMQNVLMAPPMIQKNGMRLAR
jgi:predicted RNase H-like HicB family nuclease